MPKLEVSEAAVRGVVSKCVGSVNELLALLYKLGTAQDPKQTAQARARAARAARRGGRRAPSRRSHAVARAQPRPRLTGTRGAVQAVGALYVLSKVGGWFSFITLAYMGAPPARRVRRAPLTRRPQ